MRVLCNEREHEREHERDVMMMIHSDDCSTLLSTSLSEFLSLFCRVVGLAKCPEGGVPMSEMGYYAKRPEVWDKWTKIIASTQVRLGPTMVWYST